MSALREALESAFGESIRFDEGRCPSSVTSCLLPRERFLDAARVMKKEYALLAAEWATDESPLGREFGIYACYRHHCEYLIVKMESPWNDPFFPSLTKLFVPAYRFERQIHSLMGITPKGHPDLRPWIKFEDWPEDAWPLRKSFDPSRPMARVEGKYEWAKAEGEGVYEIPVGPVHAGIIEPGHFRFQAVGETILNLEERLGYVHKGIEKRFESLSWEEAVRLAGRVSGDTTVAHSIAYCMALESMSSSVVPERAYWLRALFLERERMANHLGDIGAICNDAAFAFMLYQMMRLKEMVLRTNRYLFGHRFLMDKVVPGGVALDLSATGKTEILAEMNTIEKEFDRLVAIYEESSSLEDRVRDTGVLLPEMARELGVVGLVARASGLNLDCRTFHPFPPYDTYRRLNPDVLFLTSGDVHARTWIRVMEVRESIKMIRWFIDNVPEGEIRSRITLPGAGSGAPMTGFAAVEGWRGEIIYWLQCAPDGRINRCMVRDPSSLNWLALEQCIFGNIVPDFPLCNKSFNQSYSGHDL